MLGSNSGIVRRLGDQRANRLPRGARKVAEQLSIPQKVRAEDLRDGEEECLPVAACRHFIVPATDEERRRMRALLERLLRDVDELLDIGTAVARVQAKIEKGTN
jgi:hypothetical protein